jgi:uncharacterized pyridoxamine 5'-phosphate oxidase family protein
MACLSSQNILEVIMFDFEAILKQNPNGVLATQDGDKVRTRVFQYQFIEGNKVYFCTQSHKPVYDQLVKNPNVSFCIYLPDFNPVLSVNGKAVFVDDINLRIRMLESPLIKDIYKTPDNPVFKTFYVEVKEIETFNFEEGSKAYTV